MELPLPSCSEKEHTGEINNFSSIRIKEENDIIFLETTNDMKLETDCFEFESENPRRSKNNTMELPVIFSAGKEHTVEINNFSSTKIKQENDIFLEIPNNLKLEADSLEFEPDNKLVLEYNKSEPELLVQSGKYDISLLPVEETVKVEGIKLENEDREMPQCSYDDWKIKNEEVNFKVEDVEQNDTSISSMRFDQAKHEDHTSPKKLRAVRGCIFKCDECTYKTFHKRNLMTHLIGHKKNKKDHVFKCDQCNYETVRKSNLMWHLLRHKKPEEVHMFECDQCNYKAIQKVSLTMHLLQHKKPEEVNMFECDQCNYKTIRKGNLTKHLLRHTKPEEVQMFKCGHCNYKAIRKANLMRHLRQHKKPEEVHMFKCDQ